MNFATVGSKNKVGHLFVDGVRAKRSSGEKLKEAGMAAGARNRQKQLEFAREVARRIALKSPERTCHADDVQAILFKRGINLGPAAGSLFRGGDWEWTGEWFTSLRPLNHARLLRVWRLK